MAESSARVNCPNASREPTSKCACKRLSADVLSKLDRLSGMIAMPVSEMAASSVSKLVSDNNSSCGASRAKSGPSRTSGQGVTRNAPVEISTQANAQSPRTSEKAARKLLRRASSNVSSVRVPGVTKRITSRFTTDLEPLFLASAGLSSCSQTATRNPLRIRDSR